MHSMTGVPMMVDRVAMTMQARFMVQQGFKNIEDAHKRNATYMKRLNDEVAELKAADLRWTAFYVSKAVKDRLGEAETQLAACRLTVSRLAETKAELQRRHAVFEDALRQFSFVPPNVL